MKRSIGKTDYYKDYIFNIKKDIENSEQRLYELRNSRVYLIELIENNGFPDAYISGQGIKNPIEYLAYFVKSKDMFKSYKITDIIVTYKDGTRHENEMFLAGTLINISKYNREIKDIEEKIEQLKTFIIGYDVYKAIMDIHDELLIRYLLDGKIYQFGSGVGTVYIREKKRNYGKKVVDYYASKKEKRRLIANGEIPFKKEDKEKAELQGKEYNGKEWLIYQYDEYSYWLFWGRNKYIDNINLYSLVPSKANNTGESVFDLEKAENYHRIPNLKIGFIEMIHLTRRINDKQYLKYRENRSDLKSA